MTERVPPLAQSFLCDVRADELCANVHPDTHAQADVLTRVGGETLRACHVCRIDANAQVYP